MFAVLRECLAPVFAGVPIVVVVASGVLCRYDVTELSFTEHVWLRALAVSTPLMYTAAVYLQQLYTNWRHGARAASPGKRVLYVLLNTALCVLAAVSVLAALAFPFGDWEEGYDEVFPAAVLPSAVSVAQVLVGCCNLTPGTISFTGASVPGAAVDLLLALVPVVVVALFFTDYEYHSLGLSVGAFAVFAGRSVWRSAAKTQGCSGTVLGLRWAMLVFAVVSGIGIYGLAAVMSAAFISDDMLLLGESRASTFFGW